MDEQLARMRAAGVYFSQAFNVPGIQTPEILGAAVSFLAGYVISCPEDEQVGIMEEILAAFVSQCVDWPAKIVVTKEFDA